MNTSYVDALRAELAGCVQAGKADRVAAIKAEIKRASSGDAAPVIETPEADLPEVTKAQLKPGK